MRAGDLVSGRYELERLAGSGGMGTVYRARDKRTGEAVALKWMTGRWREAVLRFEREAETLSRVHHPCIVRYIDHGRSEQDECFIVTEWLDGESLGDRLKRQPVSLAETLSLARRVAAGLGAMHRAGVVHRDVKPGNVLLGLGRPEYAKLLDFGLVRIADSERELTQAGVMLGTPGYIAPEQARSANTVDARADVYALGCILFRCLTGRLPFEGKDSVAVLVKTMLEDAPRVSELCDVPPALDRLVNRMLGRSAHERPVDGAAVLAELEAIDPGVPPEPKRTHAPALGKTEQRVLCVVLARPTQSTRAGPEVTVTKDDVRALVERHGGRVDFLAEGSLLVTSSERGGAADQAMRAARCALALRAALPRAPIAVATGWGLLAERWPVGEVVDRAVLLLDAPCEQRPTLPVRIDGATAGLVDGRFEVGKDAGGGTLLAEREAIEPARTLLGKPTPCVGRDRELSALEAIFAECIGEPVARAVVVTAPAGMGKTRLCHELVRSLLLEHGALEVWTGRGDAMSAGSAFGVIAPAIRRAAGVLDGEPLEQRRAKLRARIARHVGTARAAWATPSAADLERVSEFIGELVGVPLSDEGGVQLRAARADAVLMGDQMKRAWEDLLAAECAAHPVLLVLEDLHWGDLPSIAFVDAALRTLRDAPLMVVAVARPEVYETFPSLWAERDVVEMRLGSLGRKACEQLLDVTLGRAVAPELARKLVDRAAGNAFYLEELIRSVAEGRGDRLPETVVAVAQARLERLEPEARRVLRAASVFGEAFWKDGVGVLLGGRSVERDLEAWLGWLSERELISRRGEGKLAGQEEFAFRHALVREAAYATLTPSDCALGHRLAGDWLERSGQTEPLVLAEHFERGGEPGRALGFYRRAAEQALEGHDFGACLERVACALRCGPDTDVLGALELLAAEAHKWRGESEAAAASAADAMRRLARDSAAWYAAAGEAAHAYGTLGRLDRLSEIAGALQIAVLRGELEAAAVVAVERVVIQLSARGRYEIADLLQARVESGAGAIAARDPSVRARILQARAERALVAGDPAEHLRLREACATAFDEAGDARNACHALVNLGYAHMEVGAYAEAVPFLRGALATSVHMGLPPVRAVAQHNLGLALARLGDLDAAIEMERCAIESAAAQGDRRVEGSSRIYMSAILQLTGDLVAADREARAAADLLEASLPGKAYATATLARVLLAQGRAPDALAAASESMAALEWLGGIEEGESLVRLVHAEALHATGDAEGAARAIAIARDRLNKRAAAIRDEQMRKGFLQSIPDNARTLALADEWAVERTP